MINGIYTSYSHFRPFSIGLTKSAPAFLVFHQEHIYWPSMDESVQLSYLQWQEKYHIEKPYQVFVPLPEGVPEEKASNLEFALGEEEIVRDIRGTDTNFTLDKHGFTIRMMDISPHWFSETEIKNRYIPETCEFVKEVVKAEHVIPFDWRVNLSGKLNIQFYKLINSCRSAKAPVPSRRKSLTCKTT